MRAFLLSFSFLLRYFEKFTLRTRDGELDVFTPSKPQREELPGRLAFRRFHPRDVISGEVHKGAQRYRATRQWSSGGCGGGDLFRNLALSTLSIRSLPSFSLAPVALFQESLHKGARREDLSPFPLSFSLHPRSGRGGCSGRHPREHSRTAITIATACLIGEGSP